MSTSRKKYEVLVGCNYVVEGKDVRHEVGDKAENVPLKYARAAIAQGIMREMKAGE